MCLYVQFFGTAAHQAPLSMGILQARILQWVAMPSPGDLPNPGIKPRSPSLQADALPSEPPRKPKNTGVASLPLLQGISRPRNWAGVSCIAGGFFTSWATRGAASIHKEKENISHCHVGFIMYVDVIHTRTTTKTMLVSGLPWWSSGKEPTCQCRRHGFYPWSGKIPHAMARHNEARVPQLLSLCPLARGLNYWSPSTLEPALGNKRNHHSEKPTHLPESSLTQQQRPSTNTYINKNYSLNDMSFYILHY